MNVQALRPRCGHFHAHPGSGRTRQPERRDRQQLLPANHDESRQAVRQRIVAIDADSEATCSYREPGGNYVMRAIRAPGGQLTLGAPNVIRWKTGNLPTGVVFSYDGPRAYVNNEANVSVTLHSGVTIPSGDPLRQAPSSTPSWWANSPFSPPSVSRTTTSSTPRSANRAITPPWQAIERRLEWLWVVPSRWAGRWGHLVLRHRAASDETARRKSPRTAHMIRASSTGTTSRQQHRLQQQLPHLPRGVRLRQRVRPGCIDPPAQCTSTSTVEASVPTRQPTLPSMTTASPKGAPMPSTRRPCGISPRCGR